MPSEVSKGSNLDWEFTKRSLFSLSRLGLKKKAKQPKSNEEKIGKELNMGLTVETTLLLPLHCQVHIGKLNYTVILVLTKSSKKDIT